MSEIQARFLNVNEYGCWDKFVSELSTVSIFDETDWLATISEIMGCSLKILGVFSGDSIIGGVTLTASKKFGMAIAGRIPLCPTNSCVLSPSLSKFSDRTTRHTLEITDAIAQVLQSNFDFVVVTNNHHLNDIRAFSWQDWRTSVQYTYCIDLPSIDISKVPPNRRNKMRNAEKAGIIVKEMDNPETAHELLEKTYKRKGLSPPVTQEQLSQIYTRHRENITLLFAMVGNSGKAVAVHITLKDAKRKAGYYLLGGFDPEYISTNAPSLLQWREIEYLREKGFKVLDLVGAEDKSIATFKSEFGGELVPYFQVSHVSHRYRIINWLSWLNPFR
ncbi:MAG: GNAT family N-acetyltransferase [Deltaproteobacteria bacterium]|nr:GNAT family N-acetyltransferase [Deltaproteobacteria bacterium]